MKNSVVPETLENAITVTVKIAGTEIAMTVDEAKKLRDSLNNLLGPQEMPSPLPTSPQPYSPYAPYSPLVPYYPAWPGTGPGYPYPVITCSAPKSE